MSNQTELPVDFSEKQFRGLVAYVIGYLSGRVVFTFRNGVEVKINKRGTIRYGMLTAQVRQRLLLYQKIAADIMALVYIVTIGYIKDFRNLMLSQSFRV